MKKSAWIVLILMLCLLGSFPQAAQAFLPKTDVAKIPAKITSMVSKVTENIGKGVNWISNSKMGKLVGDGIKATKDGIKFAKDAYESGMKYYNQGMGYVEAAKNSKEYKSAMISKQIAEESKKLRTLNEKKLAALQDIESQISIADKQASAKLENVNQNAAELVAAGNDEGAVNEYKNQQMESINASLNATAAKLEKKQKSVEKDYDGRIKEQTAKIAELTKQLANVAEIKVTIDDPLKAIEETRKKIFTEAGKDPSIAERKKLKEARYEERRRVIYEAYRQALLQKSMLSSGYEEVRGIAELSPSMPGESEGAGVDVEVLVAEAKILRRYIESVLSELNLETTVEIAKFPNVADSGRSMSKFRLCDYSKDGQPKSVKSGLASLTKTVNSVKSGAGSIIAQGKAVQQKAKAEIDAGKSKLNDVKEMKNDISDLASGVKETIKSDPAKAVNDLGGMI